MAVLVVHARLAARVELSLRGPLVQALAFHAGRAQLLRVGLQLLEVTRHARLGQEVAHGRDVAVRTVQLTLRGRSYSLDGLHRSLLGASG